jgi:hypothetical protein
MPRYSLRPRSAAHRSAKGFSASKTRVNALMALRCVHMALGMLTKKFFAFLIPVPKTSLILLPSCPMRGRFLEAILRRIERKLAGPGRPGTVDGLVVGGALGGAAPSLGRARLPCRARWVHHPPQGCPLVPWRLPSLHPLARFARDWQTSDAMRRENAEVWLFEI